MHIKGGVMKIQVLGTGCVKCNKLEKNVKEALAKSGIAGEVEKVSDIDAILDMGVMVTPALVINGELKSTGKALSVDEVTKLIEAAGE